MLTTFLSFGFLWRNPGFLPSGGAEDSGPELERRRLQQAKDPQRGIVGSQFSIFTSSVILFIGFEDNWWRCGCQSVDSAALLSLLSTLQGAAVWEDPGYKDACSTGIYLFGGSGGLGVETCLGQVLFCNILRAVLFIPHMAKT